jgi:serine/threonine-protein kinase
VPFIVFEYLQGAVLTEEIYRVGGISVRRALRIAQQIASALDAAHAANIIHLDLKSDNVLLIDRADSPDHVKVLDFGISKFMEADPISTQRNLIMGTPEFMSPEQITAPEQVDARSDIYALGVVLYEMLAARRPYADDAPRILLHRIVHEIPPALDRPNVPAELERLILDRMLAKDPADRFASMKEVHDALATIAATLRSGDSIAPPASPRASESKVDRAARVIRLPPAPAPRWPLPLFLMALFAGAGGGALLFAEQRMTASIDDAAVDALEADAAQLTAQLEASLRATSQRAEAVAAAPMLRVAIDTDASTIADLVADQ